MLNKGEDSWYQHFDTAANNVGSYLEFIFDGDPTSWCDLESAALVAKCASLNRPVKTVFAAQVRESRDQRFDGARYAFNLTNETGT